MADANTKRREITIKLFGSDIPLEKMTFEQRQKFAAEVQKQGANGGLSFGEMSQLLIAADQAQQKYPTGQGIPVDQGSVVRADAVNKIGTQAQKDAAESDRLIRELQTSNETATLMDRQALRDLGDAQDKKRLADSDIARRVREEGNAANQASAQMFGGYAAGQAALNQRDIQTVNDYRSQVSPLMTRQTARSSDPLDVQRQVDSYDLARNIAGGSLDYSASTYASDPADVQRQINSYNQLQGVGSGSLDYQAAQWASNPADVARQVQGYTDLRNIGQGSLDWESQAARAEADPDYVWNQERSLEDIRRELEFGSEGQKEVRDKLKGLSDPTVTAKERFLSELARRDAEAQDASSRAAISSNLAARGLRSGGLQVAQAATARQQTSQDRLLKELGIQAGAVDRSMQALEGWRGAEDAIRQGDQNALDMQAGLTTAMRNASFDESYKRGLGADNASAANQATRLRGTEGSAAQATNIRNASDAVGMFNTGETNTARANNQQTRLRGIEGAATQSNAIRTANDYVGTFNTAQINTAKANNQTTRFNGAQLQAVQSNAIRDANDSQRQFEDTFSQNESERIGRLAGQTADIGLAQTRQEGGRQTDVYDRGERVIDTGYKRQQDANAADEWAGGQDYTMTKEMSDAMILGGDRLSTRAANQATTTSNVRGASSEQLARALGIRADQYAIEEERGRAGL